ncbi:unnamed protein product, partial [Rotaria sp. Silwood2]
LEAANKFHPNIKLDYHIGKSIPFLDVLLTNNNGILSSSIYHTPSALLFHFSGSRSQHSDHD